MFETNIWNYSNTWNGSNIWNYSTEDQMIWLSLFNDGHMICKHWQSTTLYGLRTEPNMYETSLSAGSHYVILSRGKVASKLYSFSAPLPYECKRFTFCDFITPGWYVFLTVSAGSHCAIFPCGKIAPHITHRVKQVILNTTVHATTKSKSAWFLCII